MEIEESLESPRQTSAEFQKEFFAMLYGLNYTRIDSLDYTLRQLVEITAKEWANRKDSIIHVFRACFSEFPNNAPLYALLVGHAQTEHPEIGIAIIESVQHAFEDFLNKSEWRKLKIMLRMVGELAFVGLISLSDVIQTYKTLLSVVNDTFARQERKDLFVSLVLSALSWSGSFIDKDGVALKDVFAIIDKYVTSGREDRKKASIACRVVNADDFAQDSFLDLLYVQISKCRSCEWKQELLIDRPSSSLVSIDNSLSFPFGPIKIPLEKPGTVYPPPYSNFQVFHPNFLSSKGRVEIQLPDSESIERCILYDMVEDLLFFFDHNIKEFVRYFEENFLYPNMPYNLHQIVMEVLVANIFRLPEPDHKLAYYQTTIIFLIKAQPKIVPPILGKAFYTIFDAADNLDSECLRRFASWFTFHISNFDYKWNWKEWMPAIQDKMDESNIKSELVKEILEKLVRLAFFERVTKSFPAGIDLLPWMPPQPEPRFKYVKDYPIPEHIQFANKLLESMRLKQSDDEKKAVLEEIKIAASSGMAEGEDEAGMSLVREIVIQSVLLLGSKSFSHVMNSIERQLNLLILVTETSEGKLALIKHIFEFWHTNKQFFMITVEKLVNYKIIDPPSVIAWIFDSEGGVNDFCKTYVWDMLKKTVHKLNSRIHQVGEKVKKARETQSMDIDGGSVEKEGEEQDEQEEKEEKEDQVPALEATLDALKREQKQLFISIFQNFMRVYTENESIKGDSWKNWTLGMMREFGRHFHSEVKGFATTLEMVVFMNAENHFKDMFQQIKSIHC